MLPPSGNGSISTLLTSKERENLLLYLSIFYKKCLAIAYIQVSNKAGNILNMEH